MPVPQENPTEGGCYVIDANGQRRRVNPPTQMPEAAPATPDEETTDLPE